MSNFLIHNNLRIRTFILVCLAVFYTTSSFSQVVDLGCQEEDVAVEDLERKDFESTSGNTAIHSEGSMHNFTLPLEADYGPCKIISNITIEIDAIGVDLSNLPPDCVPTPLPYYYNIALGCADFTPASCDLANYLDEPNTPTFTDQNLSYDGDFDFGENLAIDIVPVMNINCTNGQSALSSNSVILDYEICVTVTIEDVIDPVTIFGFETICPNTTTTIAVGTYPEYEWGPNGETDQFITIGPGTYTVTVTENGCTSTDEIVITTFPTPITFDPVAPFDCDGGTVSVSVTEAYTSYEWNNPVTGENLSGQTVDLSEGTYNVTITDSNGCTDSDAIVISSSPNLPITFDPITPTVCIGGTVSVSVDEVYTSYEWNNPVTGENLSGQTVNLSEGTYNVTVTDSNGCTDSDAIVITSFPILPITFDPVSPNVCDGGTVSVSVDEVYTSYDWNNPVTGQNLSGQTANLSEGTYNVTVTDSNGCTNSSTVVVTSIGTLPITFDPVSPNVCNGGTVSVSVNEVYTSYDWNNPVTGQNLSGQTVNLSEGTYNVTVTDSNGCTNSEAIVITSSPILPITFDPVSPTVCDGGTVSVSVDEVYTSYDWNNPVTGQNLSGQTVNLSEGTYNVIVTDSNGCTNSEAIVITSNGTLPITFDPVAPTVCNGGTVSVSVDEVYTFYDWNNPVTGQNLSGQTVNLSEGTYNVTVTDSNGCTDSDAIVITSSSILPITFDPIAPNVCNGGTVSVSVDEDYTSYDWNNPVTGQNLSGQTVNLSEGTYNVTVTDSNGCTDSDAIVITSSSILPITFDPVAPTVCNGGTVSVSVDEVYTSYNWNNPVTGQNLSGQTVNLLEGTYNVTVSDSNGCTGSDAIVINSIINLLIPEFETDTIELCYDICQEINIAVVGGSPFTYDLAVEDQNGTSQATASLSSATNNFSIHLCNDQSQITFSNDTLNFGNLDSLLLTIENIQGDICDSEVIDSMWITSLPANIFQLDTSICIFDTLFIDDLEFFLGNSSYIDTIDGVSCDSFININVTFDDIDTSYILETLCAGDSTNYFSMWFSEDNPYEEFPIATQSGCDSLIIVDISFFAQADSLLNTTLCEGDFIVVNSVTYDESNPFGQEILEGAASTGCDSLVNIDLQFSNGINVIRLDTLCEGDFIVIGGAVVDESNNPLQLTVPGIDCDTTFDINLTFVPPSTNTISGTFCSDFDTLVNGNIYDISNPSNTETIVGGNYLGCDSLIVIDLQFDNGPTVIRTDMLCEGSSIVIGGTVIDESNNPLQLIVPGVDCDTTFDINLTFLPPSINTISGTFCNDFDTLVNGNLYDISNPANTETIVGGNYLGCDSLIVIDLQFDNGPTIIRTDILCEGSSIVIGGTVIDESNNPLQLIVPGVDCDTTFDINLTFVPPSTNTIIGTFCSNFDTLVNGNLYDITNPSNTEIIVGGNSFGCDSLIIIDLSFMTCDVDVIVNTIGNNCVGDNFGVIRLENLSDIPAPYIIVLEEISTGEETTINVSTAEDTQEFTNLSSGEYQITILDNTGVAIYTTTDSIDDLFAAVSGTWNLIDPIICSGDLAQLEFLATGGMPDYNYVWNNTALGNNSIIDQVPSGLYAVTVSDMNGCTYDSAFTIDEATAITFEINSTNINCLGIDNGVISIENIQGGIMPYTILFNGEATTETTFNDLASGDYTVEIVDNESCSSVIEQVTITENSVDLLADYTLEHDINLGDSILLFGDLFEDNLTFEWTPTSSLSCIDCSNPFASPNTTTIYDLTITNDQGCEQIISIVVNVSIVENILVVPNIFSPNNDGTNDEFWVNFESESVSLLELTVFDRWGNQMHNTTSSDGTIMWDGTRNGSQLSTGVYVYQLTIGYIDGSTETIVKDLTLIR